MNGIEHEIELLLDIAAAGKLPDCSAPLQAEDDSSGADPAEYNSGENDVLEARMQALWAREPLLQPCIPIILAAVEKSRGQESHALAQTELYNYTM